VAPTWQVYTKAVSPLKGLSRKTWRCYHKTA
jgi:hypothetical protein